MLFDDKARAKLDGIIHGSAVGETVGILASRMSEEERAEKLTPEGILQLFRQSDLTSTSAQMLTATVSGLEVANAVGSPSNLEIRIQLHNAYRRWAISSALASELTNIRLRRAILDGQPGSFSTSERGGLDGMRRALPVGLAFSEDAGRAFQIGAEAAAILDSDFNSYLGAGVVALITALVARGANVREAVADALQFIRPLDWSGEISNVLRSVSEDDTVGCYSHPVCSELRAALVTAVSIGPTDNLSATIANAKEGTVLIGQFFPLLANHSTKWIEPAPQVCHSYSAPA